MYRRLDGGKVDDGWVTGDAELEFEDWNPLVKLRGPRPISTLKKAEDPGTSKSDVADEG